MDQRIIDRVESLISTATFDATFTPTAADRYRFYCGSPGHQAAGMTGVLVVEP